jgi:predicted dehydrogenase
MIGRVLIVGHGSIGKRHLKIVRERLPNADIRVLRHRQSEDTAEGANGCFYDLNAALDFGPQAAILANPSPLHIPIASKLSASNCHLLIEKPLSDNLNGVDALIEQSQGQGSVLLVGYNLRYLARREALQSDCLCKERIRRRSPAGVKSRVRLSTLGLR